MLTQIETVDEFVVLATATDEDSLRQRDLVTASDNTWLRIIASRPDLDFWVANNRTIGEVVMRSLANSEAWQTRKRVAGKRATASGQWGCPVDLLRALAKDPHPAVVMSVANNPGTPLRVLSELLDHDSDAVRKAATKQVELRRSQD